MADEDGTGIKQVMTSPKVADIIEKLGVGPFLVKELFLGASIWLAAGSQLIIISAITLAIAQDWKLQGWQRGSVVSVLFVGIMLGNFASGPCSDRIGRRWPIIISYANVVIFSIASSCAPGFWTLCALRLLLGIAFGFAQPAWNTLCTEITPCSWRVVTNVASSTFFVAGEVYAAALIWFDDPMMKQLNWRSLTIYATAPAAVMGLLCLFFLNESPSWLALQGQTEKAKTVLKSIRWWNRKEHEQVEFGAPQVVLSASDLDSINLAAGSWERQLSGSEQMATATGTVLGFSTAVLCFSCFVLNFVYYGCFYAFPSVLGKVDMGVSPAVALMLGAFWELPGYVAAILVSGLCGRRVSTLIYLGLMVLSTVLFVEAAKQQKNGSESAEFFVHAGFAGMKCWINVGFGVVYQYVSEIYPTNVRVAGTGICFGCGRIGSMVVPLVFEWMMAAFNKEWQLFFHAMNFICVVNAILVLLLPFETSGMTLKDHVDEMGEMEPLVSCVDRKA